jgi:hypothetical protein
MAPGKGNDTNTSEHKLSRKTGHAADPIPDNINDGSLETGLASTNASKHKLSQKAVSAGDPVSVKTTDESPKTSLTSAPNNSKADANVIKSGSKSAVKANTEKEVQVKSNNSSGGLTGRFENVLQVNVGNKAQNTYSNKSAVSHQGPRSGMQDNVTKQTGTTIKNSPSDDARHQDSEGDVPHVKKQANASSSNQSSDEATHQGAKGNVSNVTKQAFTTNGSSQTGDATHDKTVISKENNQKPGAGKHEESSGMSSSPDLKGSRPEDKKLDVAGPSYTENHNEGDGNEDFGLHTNAYSLDTDTDHVDGDQEDDGIITDSVGKC